MNDGMISLLQSLTERESCQGQSQSWKQGQSGRTRESRRKIEKGDLAYLVLEDWMSYDLNLDKHSESTIVHTKFSCSLQVNVK